MKVLIICNSASGLLDFRGLLIQDLIQRNHCVTAIIPKSDKVIERPAERQLKELPCPWLAVPMDRRSINPFNDVRLLFAYTKILRRETPDLVITYTIKPNIYGGLVCRWLHIPYAANITGLGTAFQKDGLLQWFVTKLYGAALKKAKVVFFENVENQQLFLERRIISAKQSCLLHGAGVNLEHFCVQTYPTDSDTTRFLFMGRVMKEKGVDELLTAMQRLISDGISCSLDMLGGMEEDYSAQIQQFEKEGWLYYHGYQEDVRPFIARAHCFVLPSWHEGMANTNLECAASGRPVITSNISGCKEAVIENISGFLCEKQDADSLYQAMKKFIRLPREQKEKMGMAGRKHMEQVFDKHKVVEATIAELMK